MKERLTGAIILVALIVLVVPELLTGPLRSKPTGIASRAASRPASSVADAASSEAPPPVRSYTLALTPSAPVRSIGKRTAAEAAAKASLEGPSAPPSTAGRARPRSSSSNAAPRATAGSVAVAAGKPASPGGSSRREQALGRQASLPRADSTSSRHKPRAAARWVVQLASFSRHANAVRLAQRLRRGRFAVVIAPLRLRGRLWWRVWAGPVRGRAAAQRLAQRLRRMGLRGEVLKE